jgi:hypothetical protein
MALMPSNFWPSLKGTKTIPPWTQCQWVDHLKRIGVQAYVIEINGEIGGFFELEYHGNGDCEITVFGLVPELIGNGLGGHALTVCTEQAWNVNSDKNSDAPTVGDGQTVTRVWLHTCTLDHPHALQNYLARGFVLYKRMQRQREFV